MYKSSTYNMKNMTTNILLLIHVYRNYMNTNVYGLTETKCSI